VIAANSSALLREKQSLREGSGHHSEAIRERLGIRPGELLEFDEDAGRAVVARKAATRSGVDELYGILLVAGGTDRFIHRLPREPDA
jgi:hypothetical protein